MRWTLYLAFPAGLALVLSGLGLFLSRSVSGALQLALAARANATLQALLIRTERALSEDRPELAEDALDGVFADPEVAFVAIARPDGRSFVRRVGQEGLDLEALLNAYPTDGEGGAFHDSTFLYLSGEVFGPDKLGLGKVYLGVSEQTVQQQLHELHWEIAASLAVGTTLFALLAFAILRRLVLGPLDRMTRTALQVAAYDLAPSAADQTQGAEEFGRLAQALGHIVVNLNQSLGRTRGVSEVIAAVTDQITSTSDRVAHGAQTTFASLDETSTSMSEMVASLQGIARNVSQLERNAEESSAKVAEMARVGGMVAERGETLAQSVEHTSSWIVQMTTSIREVAGNIESLAASAAETSQSMNQMDVSIGQVEGYAEQTAQLSSQVQGDAETGVLALGKTLQGIDQIRRASQNATEVFESLRQKILNIGDSLLVIDQVAEQTNLLALNAAIIAAQAGTGGRGFAVVADEIRDLADRTSVSTREIAELVSAIQEEARASAVAMDRGSQSVEAGIMLGREAEEALRKIDRSARHQAERVQEIAQTTLAQAGQSKRVAEALDRIVATIQQMAQSTAEQVRGSEKILRAAEQMQQVTHEVEGLIATEAERSSEVVDTMAQIGERVRDLSAAQRIVAGGAGQVMNAVENITRVAEAQRLSTRDLDRAIEELRSQAEILQSEVLRFRV